MSREFIQELRGDVRSEAIDIYYHIDKKELRESYLAHIPTSYLKIEASYIHIIYTYLSIFLSLRVRVFLKQSGRDKIVDQKD